MKYMFPVLACSFLLVGCFGEDKDENKESSENTQNETTTNVQDPLGLSDDRGTIASRQDWKDVNGKSLRYADGDIWESQGENTWKVVSGSVWQAPGGQYFRLVPNSIRLEKSADGQMWEIAENFTDGDRTLLIDEDGNLRELP